MKERTELKQRIFISYSHDDIEFAERFANRLRQDGYDPWIDTSEIHAKEIFTEEIETGIFECTVFVSLLSKSYISKPFCKREISCAEHYNKPRFPLHIEKVIIPPGSGLRISFGESELGFGKDIETDEDFENLYKNFIKGMKLYIHGHESVDVTMNINLEALRQNFEQATMGGYVSKEIYTELFPAITVKDKSLKDEDANQDSDDENTEINHISINSKNNNKTLIDYIEKHKKNHIYIYGEGGCGKSVALKNIFDYFIKNQIPTIYVPLNQVHFSDMNSLEKHITDIACRNANWDNIRQLAMHDHFNPRVVLMLDGLNEAVGDTTQIIAQISEKMLWSNLQIIITSRTNSISAFSDSVMIKPVKLEPISPEIVVKHLQSKGINVYLDDNLLRLLSNPMMLTLYTEANITSQYIEKTNHSNYSYDYFPIQVTENPHTSSQIIWNYIASQLYKTSEKAQNSADRINYFVTTELFMPYLSYCLIKKDDDDEEDTSINNRQCLKLIKNLINSDCYEIYDEDRISEFTAQSGAVYTPIPATIIHTMTNKLCFAKISENGLEFTHQIFRDFFAALFLAKQIEALAPKNEENEYSSEAVTNQVYSNDIIGYLVNILEETKAKPEFTDCALEYPGKKDKLSPSKFSFAEKALNHFRGKEGEKAQIGVANLFNVLKIARDKDLSNCDFSKLDLRQCELSSNLFVNWYKEDVFPCSFDESFIDTESFVSPGHTFPVTALEINNNLIYSGDLNGVVKVWKMGEKYPVATYDITLGEPIINMAFSPIKNRLGVLTSHKLYSFDTATNTTEVLCETHNYYKYLKVQKNGEFLVSTDIEPLTWRTVDDTVAETQLPFKITCGCVAKNPVMDEFVTGLLFNNAMMFRKDDDADTYNAYRRIDMFNKSAYIVDICYHPDGSKFIVATNRTITEFDSQSNAALHRIALDGSIRVVKYFDDKIAIANGTNIVILNADFSVKEIFSGNKAADSTLVLYHNQRMFICSTKGKILELDENLHVKRARKISGKGNNVCIGECGDISTCFVFVKDGADTETGQKFNFDTTELSNLTWNYEILTSCFNNESCPYDVDKSYATNVSFLTNKENPELQKAFVFYSTIDIFECSFKNIKGNIKDNLDLIIMYGGIV